MMGEVGGRIGCGIYEVGRPDLDCRSAAMRYWKASSVQVTPPTPTIGTETAAGSGRPSAR